MMSRTITFVTGNAKKLEEIKAILGPNFPFKIENAKIDLPEVSKNCLLFLVCYNNSLF
jgi:inosine triphosphate pyrophosphatase